MRILSVTESKAISGGRTLGFEGAACLAAMAKAAKADFADWTSDLAALASCGKFLADASEAIGESRENTKLMEWVDQQYKQGYVDDGYSCLFLPVMSGYANSKAIQTWVSTP